MPNPTWVTTVNTKFNGTLDNAVIVRNTGGVKSVILWDSLSLADQAILTNAVNDNGGTVPLAGPTSGHQTLNYAGTVVGANATGLDNTTTATAGTATINLGGIAVAGNVSGLSITGQTTASQSVTFGLNTSATSPTGFAVPYAGYQSALFTVSKLGSDATGLTPDAPATAGHASITFTATPTVTSATLLGIVSGVHTFETNINNAGAIVHSVTATGTDTMASMAALMATSAGVPVIVVGNAFVITSSTTGSASSVVVTIPATSGTDLVGSINAALTATDTLVAVLGTNIIVTTYTTTIVVDGTHTLPVSVAGTVGTGDTFTNLLSAINTALGVYATATLVGVNLIVTSTSTGALSSVLITPGTLFPALTNCITLSASVAGGGDNSSVTATITIDGTPHAFSVSKSTMLTFADVITALQSTIGATGTVAMNGPDIKITSASSGNNSSVLIVDGTLLSSILGFVKILPTQHGVNKAKTYRALVTIDGVIMIALSETGIVGNTYQHVVDAINTAIGSFATAAITGGNIVITSATTGTASSVAVQDTGFLFDSLVGYAAIVKTVGAQPTTYTASVVIDGTTHLVSVTGNTIQTFTLLVAAINTAISGFGTAVITGGNIVVTSSSTGVLSTVAVVDFAGDLLAHTAGFVCVVTTVPGAVDFETVMGSTRAPNGSLLHESFSIKYVGTKPAVPPYCPHTTKFIYFDGAVWRYLDDSTAV